MKTLKLKQMVVASLLCAISIIIPVFSPFKIIIEPASFTLGSHVAIFIAMFISPFTAISVSLGSALGFFLAGFPIVIVFRAVTHIIFSTLGALYLAKNKDIISSTFKIQLFSFFIGVIHAVCEVSVVTLFYFGNMSRNSTTNSFLYSVIVLVGFGTLIHSMIDFTIALVIWKTISKNNTIALVTR